MQGRQAHNSTGSCAHHSPHEWRPWRVEAESAVAWLLWELLARCLPLAPPGHLVQRLCPRVASLTERLCLKACLWPDAQPTVGPEPKAQGERDKQKGPGRERPRLLMGRQEDQAFHMWLQ